MRAVYRQLLHAEKHFNIKERIPWALHAFKTFVSEPISQVLTESLRNSQFLSVFLIED